MTTTYPEHATAMTATGRQAADGLVSARSESPPAPNPAAAPGVSDHPAPVAGLSWWRDVAVGAAFQAEELTAGVVTGLRRTALRRREWIGELAQRGAAERIRGRRRATSAASSAVSAVAHSPLVDRVVDAQLERILRPVVLTVLDDVLLMLEQEPERIQSLIRGQRNSMVDELVNRIRTGAATGDTAVERLTFRVFRRGPLPAPAPPPDGT
jgi:hypothetical protein